MAKNLTREQLEKLRIVNSWDFCRGFWFVTFAPWARHNPWPGWRLIYPSRPNPGGSPGNASYPIRCPEDGKATPDQLQVLKPLLESLGIEYPEAWVKFMGDWMPKKEFEARMAELREELKRRGAA
jgi:pimeloyl-ACP methyl ester carboxylesterase